MITASDVWEEQLRVLCPHELPAHRAMYLIDDGPDATRVGRCIAYTCSGLDVMREQQLRDRGLWRGRGFVIGLPAPGLFWSLPEEHRWGIALHEFAHFIEQLSCWRWGTDPDLRTYMTTNRETLMQPVTLPESRPWDSHGLRWLRCGIHLHQRAAWHGWRTPIEFINVGGSQYGLSDAAAYVTALGSEPHERRDESLEAILDSEPPDAFSTLWRHDTDRWEQATNAERNGAENRAEA